MVIGVSLESEYDPIVENVFFWVPGGYFVDFFFVHVFTVYQTVVFDVFDDLEKWEATHPHSHEENYSPAGYLGISKFPKSMKEKNS